LPVPTKFLVLLALTALFGGASSIAHSAQEDPEGGSSCDYGGPGTDYSWSVDGKTLTLAPAHGADPCAPRGFLWTGEWMRVG
jgi:hypothetical protein